MRRSVYLYPGQLFTSREPATVTTILGSCVSVCLWDRSTAIGGINHYLLPQAAGSRSAPLRFGSAATDALIAQILALGGRRDRLTAKVFGGACIADAFTQEVARQLGARNVEQAFVALRRAGIPVEAETTGGRFGRKLVFQTDDGSAWVKEL